MKYIAKVNGKTFEVEVERAPSVYQPIARGVYTGEAPAPQSMVAPVQAAAPVTPAPQAAPDPVASAGETNVISPMPGKILSISVTVGQSVKAGEIILILEAMKMENEIVAPVDGTVKSLPVPVNGAVDTDQILAVIG